MHTSDGVYSGELTTLQILAFAFNFRSRISQLMPLTRERERDRCYSDESKGIEASMSTGTPKHYDA